MGIFGNFLSGGGDFAFSNREFPVTLYGTGALFVAGPTVWNSVPDRLCDPAVEYEQFRRDLKTYVFAGYPIPKRLANYRCLRNRFI